MADRLPLWRALAYGSPAFPLAVAGIPLLLYLPAAYARLPGFNLATIGLILLGARLWDLVTDPLIGWASDRYPTRFGRRKPWLALGLPLVAVSLWVLFNPAAKMEPIALLFWAFLLYLGWTMMVLPHQAWIGDISSAYHERSRLFMIREGLNIAGILLVSALPLMTGLDPASRESLSLISWIVLPLLGASVMATLFFVPEGKIETSYRPVPWRESFSALAANRAFRRLMGAYLLNGLANGLPAALLILYAEHRLEADSQLIAWFLVLYVAAGLAATPIWLWISYRLGKARTWSLALVFTAFSFSGALFLDAGDGAWFLAICALTGLGLGADLALPSAMQADAADEDATRDAGSRQGLYFGLWNLATKLALALAVGLGYPLLDWAGFEAGSQNDAFGLGMLAFLYAGAPVLLKLAAAAIISRAQVQNAPAGV